METYSFSQQPRIAIIGLGYVGLPLTLAFNHRYDVVGFDVNTHKDYQIGFANGGDQNNDTIPERAICDELGVVLIDGLGDKIQSSSWLLKNV